MRSNQARQVWRRYARLAWVVSLFAGPAAAENETIHVVLGETKLPYIDATHQRGIEYDLVTDVLAEAGYYPKVSFAPNKRAVAMFATGQVDVVIGQVSRFQSEPYISYQNQAITLCNRRIQLHGISDLSQYRIAAFHNARNFLGPDFARMAAANRNYHEASPQIVVNRMLYGDRADVAISDVNIFENLIDELDPVLHPSAPLCLFHLFPPTPYRLSFHSEEAMVRFNEALARLTEHGMYARLAKRYGVHANAGWPYFRPGAGAPKLAQCVKYDRVRRETSACEQTRADAPAVRVAMLHGQHRD